MGRFAILLIAALVLVGCSKEHEPPSGRWIGHYETNQMMVAAWLEILPGGQVRVSAPDLLNIDGANEEARVGMRHRLASDLFDNWGQVQLRRYDFDGRTFRKQGGFAPQMEWDPKKKLMKLVFYFGMQRSIRIPMTEVKDFNDDPWLPS